MIVLPHLLSRLPLVRSRLFQPRITLRRVGPNPALDVLVVRFGLMPDGEEVNLGSTVHFNLDDAIRSYLLALSLDGYRVIGHIEVEGTDFAPLSPREP